MWGIRMANVKIYSTPVCPWCKKAKDFFDENNVDYNDFDVSSDESKRNEQLARHFSTQCSRY